MVTTLGDTVLRPIVCTATRSATLVGYPSSKLWGYVRHLLMQGRGRMYASFALAQSFLVGSVLTVVGV